MPTAPSQVRPKSGLALIFLGSGGSSVRSRRRPFGSSSCSESDSNSDNSKDTNGDKISSTLHQRIIALENELLEVKGKLGEYKGKDSTGRCDHLENGDHVDRISSVFALEKDLMVVDVKIKSLLSGKNSSSETAHYVPSLETKQDPELKEVIVIMEVENSQHMEETDNLKAAQLSAYPSDDDSSVGDCKADLSIFSKIDLQEKSGLETEVANLEDYVDELKTVTKTLLQEKFLLESKLKEQELWIGELQVLPVPLNKSYNTSPHLNLKFPVFHCPICSWSPKSHHWKMKSSSLNQKGWDCQLGMTNKPRN